MDCYKNKFWEALYKISILEKDITNTIELYGENTSIVTTSICPWIEKMLEQAEAYSDSAEFKSLFILR